MELRHRFGKRNQNLVDYSNAGKTRPENLELHLYADDMEVMDAAPFGQKEGMYGVTAIPD